MINIVLHPTFKHGLDKQEPQSYIGAELQLSIQKMAIFTRLKTLTTEYSHLGMGINFEIFVYQGSR